MELPKRDGSTYTVTADQLKRFQESYRGLDVVSEVRKAREWLLANPSRRKLDCHRFLVNWLNRAHERTPKSVTVSTSKHYALVAERQREQELPARYAPQEVVQSHMQSLRKMLGMRRGESA